MSNIPYKTSGMQKLAPDLTRLSQQAGANDPYITITGINASAGLTTALSLSGRFSLSWLEFTNMTAENNTYKLTIDDVVIFNDTFSSPTSLMLIGATSASNQIVDGPYLVEKSLLLEVQTATDTSIDLNYLARPIV